MTTPGVFTHSRSTRIALSDTFTLLAGVALFTALSTTVLAGGGSTSSSNASADNFSTGPTVDTSSAIVQLTGAPVSTNPGTKPAAGRKINFNSTAVKSYRAQLAAERNSFRQWL